MSIGVLSVPAALKEMAPAFGQFLGSVGIPPAPVGVMPSGRTIWGADGLPAGSPPALFAVNGSGPVVDALRCSLGLNGDIASEDAKKFLGSANLTYVARAFADAAVTLGTTSAKEAAHIAREKLAGGEEGEERLVTMLQAGALLAAAGGFKNTREAMKLLRGTVYFAPYNLVFGFRPVILELTGAIGEEHVRRLPDMPSTPNIAELARASRSHAAELWYKKGVVINLARAEGETPGADTDDARQFYYGRALWNAYAANDFLIVQDIFEKLAARSESIASDGPFTVADQYRLRLVWALLRSDFTWDEYLAEARGAVENALSVWSADHRVGLEQVRVAEDVAKAFRENGFPMAAADDARRSGRAPRVAPGSK